MRRLFVALGVAAALIIGGTAMAVQPDEVLDDAALESRSREISAGLRCLVCQNQSIDDSDAPLARDLRLLVRERLVAGDSDTEVVVYLVDRYGDYILLKPPFKWTTLVLWSMPAVTLVAGLGLTAVYFRRRAAPQLPPRLSADEEAALKRMLSKDG